MFVYRRAQPTLRQGPGTLREHLQVESKAGRAEIDLRQSKLKVTLIKSSRGVQKLRLRKCCQSFLISRSAISGCSDPREATHSAPVTTGEPLAAGSKAFSREKTKINTHCKPSAPPVPVHSASDASHLQHQSRHRPGEKTARATKPLSAQQSF